MTQKVAVFVGAFAFFFATASGVTARPQTEHTYPQNKIGTRLSANGIPNFGQVTPHLFRGGQPNSEGLQKLKTMGIEVVVDLRGSASKSEQAALEKLGMQYVSIPSHCPFPKDKPWAEFLQVMRQNRGRHVFVHCRLGDDRTGMAVAAYRMAEENWSPEEALEEMKMFGFSSVHHAICPGLEGYVERFPERLKSSPAFRDLSQP
jgi:protein tyrosine/serine phosphatase